MKSINVYFDDDEYEKLVNLKDELSLSWRDFIITLAKKYNGDETKNERK